MQNSGTQRQALAAAWQRIDYLPEIKMMCRMRFAPISARAMHGGASADNYELLHVFHGENYVITRRSRTRLKPGDTILIPGSLAHRDQFDFAKGLEVFEIGFAWPAGKSFLAALAPTPCKIRSARGRNEAAALVESMQGDLAWGRPSDMRVAQSRLLTLLLIMARDGLDWGRGAKLPARGEGLRKTILVQRARVYISTHYRDPLTLKHVASALGVSSCYLSHIFHAEMRFSLMSFLTRVRMAQAKTMLSRGASNVEEAARAAGYHDSRYFAKVFHKHFGYPPGMLRV